MTFVIIVPAGRISGGWSWGTGQTIIWVCSSPIHKHQLIG